MEAPPSSGGGIARRAKIDGFEARGSSSKTLKLRTCFQLVDTGKSTSRGKDLSTQRIPVRFGMR